MDPADAKRRAADAALHRLPEVGVVGLGSGSTATLFIHGVGNLVKQGRRLHGVPTSEASRTLAVELGIPLLGDEGPWSIDVTVDGADEVNAELDVIKGGGGCHTREKIVNQSSAYNVIVVDETKLSKRLGERWAVPVEVMPFGRGSVERRLAQFGKVSLRYRDGRPWITDAGNFIYDVQCGAIAEPKALDVELCSVAGVVATGLFVGCVDEVIVAGPEGVRTLQRS